MELCLTDIYKATERHDWTLALSIRDTARENVKELVDTWHLQAISIYIKQKKWQFQSRCLNECYSILEESSSLIKQMQGVKPHSDNIKLELETVCNHITLCLAAMIDQYGSYGSEIELVRKRAEDIQTNALCRILQLFGSNVLHCSPGKLEQGYDPSSTLAQKINASTNEMKWDEIDFQVSRAAQILLVQGTLFLLVHDRVSECLHLAKIFKDMLNQLDCRAQQIVQSQSLLLQNVSQQDLKNTLTSISICCDLIVLNDAEKKSMYLACTEERLHEELDLKKDQLHILLKALVLLKNEKYTECASYVEEVISSCQIKKVISNCVQYMLKNVLGISLVKMGKIHSAQQIFGSCLDSLANNDLGLLNFARCLNHQGKAGECVKVLAHILQLHDDNNADTSTKFFHTDQSSQLLWMIRLKIDSIWKDKCENEWPLYIAKVDRVGRCDVLFLLAQQFKKLKKYEQASDAFLDLLHNLKSGCKMNLWCHLNMKIEVIYRLCCYCSIKCERYKVALDICTMLERWITSSEDTVCLCWVLPYQAECQRQLKSFENALGSLEKALNLNPCHRELEIKLDHRYKDFDLKEYEEPQTKKQKLNTTENDLKLRHVSTIDTMIDKGIHFEKTHLLNNMAVVMSHLHKNTDEVFDAIRGAIQKCRSSDSLYPELVYNYCRWLHHHKTERLAMLNWNTFHQRQQHSNIPSTNNFIEDYKSVLY